MRRYRVTVTGVFDVTAENIVEARRVASKLRVIGAGAGSRRITHNRDFVSHRARSISTNTKIETAKEKP